MKSVKSALLLAAVASSLVACSANDDVNNEVKNGLEGTYTFVAMKADTYVDAEYHYSDDDMVIRTISTSTYDAKNLGGTITINATKFNSNKFKYTVETILNGKTYTNGEQTGFSSMPVTFDIPESSGSSDYKLIGTDSIYFAGGFVSSPALGDTMASKPSGARYKWEGDTLVISSEFRQLDTSRVSDQGMTQTTYSDKRSKQIMRFKKN